MNKAIYVFVALVLTSVAAVQAADPLKVHGIFRSNMVLQRDKPITVWGWAPAGSEVKVSLGDHPVTGKAGGDKGRWEVAFDPQPANANGQTLKVQAGDQTIEMNNILIGDVWVMNGQSNMAFGLRAVYQAQFEASMAHLPLLRHIRINSYAESEHVETDLEDKDLNGKDTDKNWKVVTPEVAMDMGAIGYIFASRVQRALQIPIGIIDNSRGGASLESLVPRHKFKEHPMAAEYLAWVEKRQAEFDWDGALQKAVANWEKAVADQRKKGVAEDKLPAKPTRENLRSWNVPGRSPSDAASCYNGMFGVFKGLNIKGVAFHQGFNNAMMNTSCKPKFYRILMKLMVDGWREDFNDPQLPVAVIGLCAGGQAQARLNFEQQGFSTAAYIRESQRLGLADVANPANTAFIPSYDQKIPQLHTKKKKELGLRTARWALKTVYGYEEIVWDTANLVSAVREGSGMLLTFDKAVRVDDFGSEIEGFSIADESGVFYMATAIAKHVKEKELRNKQISVSSPLVKEPTAVRYAWARSPMGNLKVNGMPWQPLHSFRTDAIDFTPEVAHQDSDGSKKNSEAIKALKAEAAAALKKRLEASQAASSKASSPPSSKTVTPVSSAANPIPVLETKGDVYKTVGPNDAEIYGPTIGHKKMIMLYAAFKEQEDREDTREVAKRMLGDGRFLDIFHRQSYGKLKITIDHVHGWREMPRPRKENDPTTTEGHRQMFVDLFALYPKVDFRKYDYVVAKMPGRGNFAFGERDDKAIPYRGSKINVGVNIGSNNPGTLAHEVAHCMGLPDLYSLGDVEGPRNPLGQWDLMSSGGRASGFIGWQRHKLGWMDAGRKTYLTKGTHSIDLTPLDAKEGISMVVVPADDPKRPSVVFVVEIGQPPRPKEGEPQWPAGVLIYRVDGTRPTGKHAVVIFPRENFAEGASFLKGDAFSHDDAPFDLEVVKGLEGGGFRVKIEVKR